MSISKPQNRTEFKQHILTKLGAPVLEINVSDEQMDIAIDDAFQFLFLSIHVSKLQIQSGADQHANAPITVKINARMKKNPVLAY